MGVNASALPLRRSARFGLVIGKLKERLRPYYRARVGGRLQVTVAPGAEFCFFLDLIARVRQSDCQ
jgi:hypothetical protein